MNPDPRESAAWRSFGMLTPDESAAFDEAASRDSALSNSCQEMDRLAAAVAVASSLPVTPRSGQLDRLHRRLGLPIAKRTNWPAISGWAAAAALAGIAVLRPTPPISPTTVTQVAPSLDSITTDTIVVASEPEDTETVVRTRYPAVATPASAEIEIDRSVAVKIETKQLIQEIEVLRGKLENFQIRDRERFEPTPGMAWPIVMRMVPPDPPAPPQDVYNAAAAMAPAPVNTTADEPPMAAMLGDALAYSRASATAPTPPPPAPPASASAIPIYDAARDKGTLVVNNLPAKTSEESYNLWVTTDKSKQPIYVGRLPESSKPGADSIDFSLGATAIVPSGFVLTRDPQGTPRAPSESSTILLGPR